MTEARTSRPSLRVGLATAVVLAGWALGLLSLPVRAADPAPPVQPSPANRASAFWPQWRGPLATGEAPFAKPPVEWSADKNIRWKVPLAGKGKSTPIVWGDLVVLTTAAPRQGAAGRPASTGARASRQGPPRTTPPDTEHEFTVWAFDRRDGRVRWLRIVHTERPHEGTHPDGTFASGSALTDGERIYAFFGSRGLYALDFTGRVLWQKQIGKMQTRLGFGEGASPAVHKGTLVVTWDHEGADFVMALDAKTGAERWRRERDEPTTWATPLIVEHGGRAQVVVNGSNRVAAYDLGTGEPVWTAGGLTANVIPSPVAADGVVYAMSGFRGNMARAIRLADARGEVTGAPTQAWTYERDTPYVPSPLLYRGVLYFLKSNSGVLTSLDPATGRPHYTERLQAVPKVYASPVAADGRVYIVGREGTTVVLAAGPTLHVVATNVLDDAIDASPALVDGEIYLRGAQHLYRISAD